MVKLWVILFVKIADIIMSFNLEKLPIILKIYDFGTPKRKHSKNEVFRCVKNRRFLTVFEGFDRCKCGGKLIYRKHLNSSIDDFSEPSAEKDFKTKLSLNSKMIKPLGLGVLFIFGLLIKFHAFNYIIYYFAHSNSNFLYSSPIYVVLLIALGFFLSYLGRFTR